MAERSLRLDEDGVSKAINVRPFAPERHGSDWSCRTEIDWPDAQDAFTVHGIDAFQAVILAMQNIGARIYFSDYHKSGALRWGAKGSGYGFPVPKNARDLLIGHDARFEG